MDGMANRMGMMVGGAEKFFDSNWYHRLFLQYIKQKHRDFGSLSVFRGESFGDQRETGIMAKFLGILLLSLQLSQDCEDSIISVSVEICL